jgi:hypothetical protein
MEAIQTLDPNELPNWLSSCPTCMKNKTILLRNHIAEANHNARIYTGHKMKFLREPKILQQRLYNQNKKDVMLELEYWLHDSETRHYGLRTITNAFIWPLPDKLMLECRCPIVENEAKPPTIIYAARPLLMKPLGLNKFTSAAMF